MSDGGGSGLIESSPRSRICICDDFRGFTPSPLGCTCKNGLILRNGIKNISLTSCVTDCGSDMFISVNKTTCLEDCANENMVAQSTGTR